MAKLRSIFKKHLIPNLERKCRLCLSDKAIVQAIFQPENSKEMTDTLVEKIFECTAIMLSKDYDFPSPICEDCALKLDEFLLFRTKCLRSNEIYRFNRLHKQRLLFGRPAKPAEEDRDRPETESTASTDDPEAVCPRDDAPEDGRVAHIVPSVVIAEASGSSSSDNRTVIETEEIPSGTAVTLEEEASTMASTLYNGACTMEEPLEHEPECNGDHRRSSTDLEEIADQLSSRCKPPPDPDDSEDTGRLSPAPVVVFVDETDTGTVSETEYGDELILMPEELLDTPEVVQDPPESIGEVQFPIETVEQLDQLERLVRGCDSARGHYVDILRRTKTHDTSLSETYQRLFADKLLIHYNYDGISPKYNKRPLKTLHLFTECMAVAWEDHMDASKVREAVIEAVRKSHNRYNQYNHRKLRMVIAEDTTLKRFERKHKWWRKNCQLTVCPEVESTVLVKSFSN